MGRLVCARGPTASEASCMGFSLRLPRPLCALVATATLLTSQAGSAGEVLREQDAAGRVRVVREVSEDAAGNCVNHGLWHLRGPDGQLAAEGRYELGLRTSIWRRWLSSDDIPMESTSQFVGFQLPLTSQAEYAGGVMVGTWAITDARGRTCTSIQLDRGTRHGDACWWSPAGTLVRRENFKHGRLDGEVYAWNQSTQTLEHAATWVDGCRLVRSIDYYPAPSSDRRAEGDFLLGPQLVTLPDDFWETRLAQHRFGQECIPHGHWKHWHPGGQVAAEGRYAWGRPVGEFTWRHANGQKLAVGSYADDGRPAGVWRWWNPEGAHLAAVSLDQATGQPSMAILKTGQTAAIDGAATHR
jgi:antitoxin component YwqK of YwqJK toxin-antitoxin module